MAIAESLREAVLSSNIDRVNEIVTSDPAPPQGDLDEALTDAISSVGDDRAITPLLSNGARVTLQSFYMAAHRNDTVVLEAFRDYGWDVNSVEFGQPLLRLVVDKEVQVKWLLENGADPNIRSNKNVSPLATASLIPSTRVLDLLISHGAELDPHALFNSMSPRGQGDLPIMSYLIGRGIDVNAVEKQKGSALHYAVDLGSLEKVELLLKHGADRTKVAEYGLTPIELAEKKGLKEICEILSRGELVALQHDRSGSAVGSRNIDATSRAHPVTDHDKQ